MRNESLSVESTQRVYVTGGSGFLGTHLRAALADRDVPVTLLLHSRTDIDLHDTETVEEGDVLDPSTFSLAGHDTVFHLAAQTSVSDSVDEPGRTWRINADGTANVLEAARRADVERFLYASTASVYGPPSYLPVDETHPTNPAEPYGASKLAGDGLVRAYASSYEMEAVVARIFNTFGPDQPSHNVVGTIMSQALESDEVELGNLSPARDFIYVKDVIAGLLTIIEEGTSGTAYNIGLGQSVKIGELAERLIAEFNPGAEVVSRNDRRRSENIEIPDYVADTARLRQLGWKPEYNLESAISDMNVETQI